MVASLYKKLGLILALSTACFACGGAKCTTLSAQSNASGCARVWDCPDAEWSVGCVPADGGFACTCSDTSGATKPPSSSFSSQDYCSASAQAQADEARSDCGVDIEE